MISFQGVALSAEELESILQIERIKCEKLAERESKGNGTCKTIWDGILCWPSAYSNQVLTQQCPSYIAGFDHLSNATKECTENGTWFISPKTHQEWTDYNKCFTNQETTIFVQVSPVDSILIKEYLPILKAISHVGYGISLVSLVVASIILFTCRKLYCPRNTLHLHLFVSFIMRAFVTFLKEFLFEQGVGLKSDFVVRNGTKYFVEEINDNWECKGLTTVWQYFIMANYSWILMEGLYIHNLLMFALFSDNGSIILYVALGWGLPLVFVVAWALVRINLENDLCWTTNSISQNFLIIRVPIIIAVLLNFGLFLNIVRLLLLKVRSSVQEETQRYWRLAKSTMVLAPLFGVHYTIFLGMSYSVGINETVELIWLFCDQLFASFQGFFVAVFYCFLNSEVQTEIKKKMRRLMNKARVTDGVSQRRSTFVSWPSSCSINNNNSIFALCRSFSSRNNMESRESKRTVDSEDFVYLPDVSKSIVENKSVIYDGRTLNLNNGDSLELDNFMSEEHTQGKHALFKF
ncbi:hypothetical protein RUM44_005857 [Polyplax serrata]|uniref:Uncharacterized protein n=1 Tax=Polyplax serrata TaxID=468196 RepID=A0ABR1B047_POLSC